MNWFGDKDRPNWLYSGGSAVLAAGLGTAVIHLFPDTPETSDPLLETFGWLGLLFFWALMFFVMRKYRTLDYTIGKFRVLIRPEGISLKEGDVTTSFPWSAAAQLREAAGGVEVLLSDGRTVLIPLPQGKLEETVRKRLEEKGNLPLRTALTNGRP